MNEEKRINNYFDRVKQNPPLMDIEQVQQILNKAEVETKSKVEKGRPNLLKFTVMTTLIAIIVSAFLFWPNTQDGVSNSNNPILNEPVKMIESSSTNKEMIVEEENNISAHDNEMEKVNETERHEKIPGDTIAKNFSTSTVEERDSISNKASSIESLSKNPKIDSLQTIESLRQEYVYPEQILDSTLFIDLSRSQFESLGFKLNNDAVELFFDTNMFTSYSDGRLTFGIHLKESSVPKNGKDSTKHYFEAKQAFILLKDTVHASYQAEIIPMLISNSKGESLLKMGIPELKLKTLFSKRFEKDFKTLLPVVMRKDIFGDNLPQEDIVYWFLPTDDFFNRLPQNISEELLTEFDYITAEDKSVLEKPDCKYFEECKNTLNLSDFKVFPNPARSNVTVSFCLNEPVVGKISLVDIAGRERQVIQSQTTLSLGSHRFDLDVSSIPDGIYLIALYSDNGIQTQQLIVKNH